MKQTTSSNSKAWRPAQSAWWVIFCKEVRENLRDRRALMSSLVVGAMFGPLLFALMFKVILGLEQERAAQVLKVPVIGAEHAPQLVNWLQRRGAEVSEAPADPLTAVRLREVDLVLEIPAEYPEQWRRGEPALLNIIHDSSRRDTRTLVTRLQALVASWGAQVGHQRLRVRAINPDLVQAVRLGERDVSTPESRGALVLSMWPYLVMLAVFMGGMYLAIDATAGERERQSMEPLLLNPISRRQVVTGKIFATMAFSLTALLLTLIMYRLGLLFLPLDELGLRLNMGTAVLASVFLMMLPVALVAAAVQTLVAAFSKGFREAQTYVSFLSFIPMVPGIWLALSPIKPSLSYMWVPLLNQSMLIQMLSRDEAIPLYWHAPAWLTTALLGGILLFFAQRCYARPAIIAQ